VLCVGYVFMVECDLVYVDLEGFFLLPNMHVEDIHIDH
jgi:hypothetical protein